ncbi:MAG: hypothetical protein CSA62_15295 [Planctomycetota bacterium]|nr:MAG: hypothetical protein CSA62_15295 [Planctomycetota bacterium]
MSATKHKIDAAGALELLQEVSKVVVAKGKKTLVFKVKDGELQDVEQEEFLGVVMGRSGKLRAPTMRKGKTLFVGFSDGLIEAGL